MKLQLILAVISVAAVQATSEKTTPLASGKAIVANKCDYNVYLNNQPADEHKYREIDRILAPSGRYEQYFTPLANGGGWSIQVSKIASFGNALEYRYSWQPASSPEEVQFHVGGINENPWRGDYRVLGNGSSCHAHIALHNRSNSHSQQMQTCPSNTDITIVLCYNTATTWNRASNSSSGQVSVGPDWAMEKTRNPKTSPITSDQVVITSSNALSSFTSLASPTYTSISADEDDTVVIVEVKVETD